jgi:diguanylate cyclase (GGDEF)-like protein/PAS domain S-box-containing protein
MQRNRNTRAPILFSALLALLLGAVVLAGAMKALDLRGNRGEIVIFITLLAAMVLSVAFTVGCLTRIMEQRHAQLRFDETLLHAFLEYIPDNVYFKDLNSRFVRISTAMASFMGVRSPAEAMKKTDADIYSSEHAGQALADEREIIRTGQPIIDKEEKETWPDGRETWALTTKLPLRDERGNIIGTMGISHNITDRKQAQIQLRYAQQHDALTGLPNRFLVGELLDEAITAANGGGKHTAVIALTLDRFDDINDALGNEIGDQVLLEVTRRLRHCLADKDTLARVGGDDFVVIAPGMEDREAIEHLARRLLASLGRPMRAAGHEIQMAANAGICQCPQDGRKAAALLQFAHTAMREAQRRAPGGFWFFSPALAHATRREQELATELRSACLRDEFVLQYQPFVSTETGEITGLEALLRWKHPVRGLVLPRYFLPQLEELGLLAGVGRWVLKTACRQNAAWQQHGLKPIRMAVNVSAQQFYGGSLVDTIRETLEATGLDPKWLEVELTEGRAFDDSEGTIAMMSALRRTGVSLALDDFGTGWSSLSYLRRFPIERIKIDQSFIRDLESSPSAETVVRSILNLGNSLGIACTAEGVENRAQLEYLRRNRCSEVQGYLFGHPVSAVDCTSLLRTASFGSRENAWSIPDTAPAIAQPAVRPVTSD